MRNSNQVWTLESRIRKVQESSGENLTRISHQVSQRGGALHLPARRSRQNVKLFLREPQPGRAGTKQEELTAETPRMRGWQQEKNLQVSKSSKGLKGTECLETRTRSGGRRRGCLRPAHGPEPAGKRAGSEDQNESEFMRVFPRARAHTPRRGAPAPSTAARSRPRLQAFRAFEPL